MITTNVFNHIGFKWLTIEKRDIFDLHYVGFQELGFSNEKIYSNLREFTIVGEKRILKFKRLGGQQQCFHECVYKNKWGWLYLDEDSIYDGGVDIIRYFVWLFAMNDNINPWIDSDA